jgi:hypothetical protein
MKYSIIHSAIKNKNKKTGRRGGFSGDAEWEEKTKETKQGT